MFGIGPATRIYLAAGSTDMRKRLLSLCTVSSAWTVVQVLEAIRIQSQSASFSLSTAFVKLAQSEPQ